MRTIILSDQQLAFLLTLLQRVQIQGAEAPSLVDLLNTIQRSVSDNGVTTAEVLEQHAGSQ